MNKIFKIVAIISIVVGIFFRFYYLRERYISYDELAVIKWSRDGLLSLIDNIAKFDSHPRFFYILQYPFTFFKNYHLSLRIVPLISSLLSILIVYLIAEELFSKNSGYFAAAFLSLLPFHIYHSQIARMYSTAIFMIFLTIHLAIKASKEPTVKNGIFLSISVLLTAYTHYYTLFILPLIPFLVDRNDTSKKFIIDLPLFFLLWGYLPLFFISSSSPFSQKFSDRLTGWLKIDGWNSLVGGLNLIDFNLFFLTVPTLSIFLIIISSLMLFFIKGKNLSTTLAIIFLIPLLIFPIISNTFHLIFGKYIVQPNHYLLLIPIFVLLITSIFHHGDSHLSPIIASFLMVSLFFALLLFESGQLSAITYKNLKPLTSNYNLIPKTQKDKIELINNLNFSNKKTNKITITISNYEHEISKYNSLLFDNNPHIKLLFPNSIEETSEIEFTPPPHLPFFPYEMMLDNKKIKKPKIPIAKIGKKSQIKISVIPPFFYPHLYHLFPIFLFLFLLLPFIPSQHKILCSETSQKDCKN